jgi:hypothetical protein
MVMGDSPTIMLAHEDVGDDAQPSIEAMEDAQESPGVDEEDELSADQIRVSRKVNSIATIEALRLKPSSLSRMMVPLCRMVAMPIVRPTLSSNLASLEVDFIHGYRKGMAVFYLSTTNEGGLVEEVSDEDLQSWGPLWYAVNTRFEDYLSSVPELRHLKGVKFSVCDGNHRRQAWWNVISRLHSTDLSWHYMVDSIILETQGKLGVVMLAMHDINMYISSAYSYLSYSFVIEVAFEFCW